MGVIDIRVELGGAARSFEGSSHAFGEGDGLAVKGGVGGAYDYWALVVVQRQLDECYESEIAWGIGVG